MITCLRTLVAQRKNVLNHPLIAIIYFVITGTGGTRTFPRAHLCCFISYCSQKEALRTVEILAYRQGRRIDHNNAENQPPLNFSFLLPARQISLIKFPLRGKSMRMDLAKLRSTSREERR